jgi:hypothetical protein
MHSSFIFTIKQRFYLLNFISGSFRFPKADIFYVFVNEKPVRFASFNETKIRF